MDSSEKESICYSKTSPDSEDIQSEDECQGENKSSKLVKDGGSSSNSTVEEGETKKPLVRQYVRSKLPRLRWTPDLHTRFVRAVERLGGQDRATPKSVLQLMDIKGLKIAHVKSHLQMYRSKKIEDESNSEMMMMTTDHRLFMEGVDQKSVFKLTKFPLFPNFNREQTSNLRYGDQASWNGHGKWNFSSTKPGFYNPNAGRIFTNHFHRPENPHHFSKINSLKEKFNQDFSKEQRNGYLPMQESWSEQSTKSPTELISSLKLLQQRFISNGQKIWSDTAKSPKINRTGFKRKAPDYELDLNLSLGLESRTEEEQQGTVLDEEDLNLSLYSYQVKKQAKDVVRTEKARGMSTLDLTL